MCHNRCVGPRPHADRPTEPTPESPSPRIGAPVTLRHLLSWKPLFYQAALPALRRLGPAWGDAMLGLAGRAAAALWPPRRRALSGALRDARAALDADWDPETLRPALAANALRFLARDYPLDLPGDDNVLARFDVEGLD